MHWLQLLTQHLKADEGFRGRPYQDTTGHLTIGYGHNLDVPITPDVGDRILKDDIYEALFRARDIFGSQFDLFPNEVKIAICNMVFQLGSEGFRKFKDTIQAIQENRYADAADHALDSLWAKQTPNRAKRVTELLRGRNVY